MSHVLSFDSIDTIKEWGTMQLTHINVHRIAVYLCFESASAEVKENRNEKGGRKVSSAYLIPSHHLFQFQ